jgi:hypothetical protein
MTRRSHPDVVAALIRHLSESMAVPVTSRVPNPRPSAFVTLRRIGGQEKTQVSDAPTVTVEAWADDDGAAHDIAQEARSLIREACDGADRHGSILYRYREFAGPGNLPDPDSRQSRYVFTVSLHARGGDSEPPAPTPDPPNISN